MSTVSTGPAPDLSKKFPAGSEQENRPTGNDQQQPQPNENLANQPVSSKKTMDGGSQQHTWGDQDPQEGVSTGVSEGHSDPQKPKHGDPADATSKSGTGLPEEGDDREDGGHHRPPSVQNRDNS